MKKLLPLLIIAVLIGALFLLGQKYLRSNVNIDILTQIAQPGKNSEKSLPSSSQLAGLEIFADLKGALPRALAFDKNGVLFASVPAQGKIIALPDANRDGKADRIVEVITGLSRPHGIAFDGNFIYIGETDKVVRASYNADNFTIGSLQTLFSLPDGGRHFTRTMRILKDKLYTSVGSSCDTCVEKDEYRAAILVSNLDGSGLRVFARGLRNSVFFTFDSQGKLWGADMGRDFLGDNLPPDEINIIEDGKDYGWPYCYGDRLRDSNFMPGQKTDYCLSTQSPLYQLPAHVAPLGVVFDKDGNLLVALHGSWNSTVPVGYKIVKLNLTKGKVVQVDDFVTGFITPAGKVVGRPVDLIFNKEGELFVSDDYAGVIYLLRTK
ncbi:hypothetical protein A2V61_03180 [Candidatus Woesebacteria bacterium RBG_19FT_COMBO_47_8]|nr:MAG: hypothetical protein A2V61_03180 [Candidatus Woesebacteria bacterium RBG_19FT_COMBO_47_8]